MVSSSRSAAGWSARVRSAASIRLPPLRRARSALAMPGPGHCTVDVQPRLAFEGQPGDAARFDRQTDRSAQLGELGVHRVERAAHRIGGGSCGALRCARRFGTGQPLQRDIRLRIDPARAAAPGRVGRSQGPRDADRSPAASPAHRPAAVRWHRRARPSRRRCTLASPDSSCARSIVSASAPAGPRRAPSVEIDLQRLRHRTVDGARACATAGALPGLLRHCRGAVSMRPSSCALAASRVTPLADALAAGAEAGAEAAAAGGWQFAGQASPVRTGSSPARAHRAAPAATGRGPPRR